MRVIDQFRTRLIRARALRHSGAAPVTGAVAICMVKNEQDVIEPFLRHNARFFDAMVVMDNASDDRTRDIIAATARDLGNVFVTDLPVFAYTQSRTMTAALHYVQSAFFADVVAFLDADEFIAAPDRAGFDATVARIPVGQCGLMAWQTYMPGPDSTPGGDPLAQMTWRRRAEYPGYSKAILRLGGRVDPGLVVEQGYHGVRDALGRRLPAIALPDMPLMHLPVRSSDQIIAKGVIGWMANAARDPASYRAKQSFQKKRIFDRVQAGLTVLPPAELAAEALIYAQAPDAPGWAANAVPAAHGIDLTRHHSDGSFGDRAVLVAAAQARAPMASQAFALPPPRNRDPGHTGIENAFSGGWRWDFLVLDAPPLRWLAEAFRPASAMDIGCGNGAALHLLQSRGVADVLGVDGIDPEATVLPPDAYRTVDLQQPFDAGRTFDLVMCLEVVEHLRPEATATAIDTIARHARDLILFSVAAPGQPGNGHINCHSIDQALALWAARGWQPLLMPTLALRALSTMSWFRHNLLLLQRTGDTGDTSAARALRRIGALPYRWYNQPTGVRLAAFAEGPPGLTEGYGLRL